MRSGEISFKTGHIGPSVRLEYWRTESQKQAVKLIIRNN